jgi:predicted ATP-dependent serine protease
MLDAEARGIRKGVQTPWPVVNDLIGGGLWPGEVGIASGPGGNGKSWLSLSICIHAEVNGIAWAYLPLEDGHEKWLRRMLAMMLEGWTAMRRNDRDASKTA